MPIPTRHGFLARWYARHITMDDFAIDDAGAVKTVLAERYGINARGWRLYQDYGDTLFERLGTPWASADNPYATGHNGVVYLRLLQACELDVLPPLALLASMKDWGIPRNLLRHVPPMFFRTAWKACIAAEYGGVPPEQFAGESLVPLARWFFDTGLHERAEASLLKAGWPTLERRFEEWQRDRFRFAEDRCPAPPEWPPFVRRVEADGLVFVALSSEAALDAEGLSMAHCVGGYGEWCREGRLRIFSVRCAEDGRRLATLALQTTEPGCWVVDQLKGRYNAPVADGLFNAARQAADALEDAYRLVPAIRASMERDWHRAEQVQNKHLCEEDRFDDCPF